MSRQLCLCASTASALFALLRTAHSADKPTTLAVAPQPHISSRTPDAAAALLLPTPSPSRRISTALARYPNLSVLYQSPAVLALFTTIRNAVTPHREFSLAADRLLRILAEEGLAEVRGCRHTTVATPCGAFEGLLLPSETELAVVSIVRAGDALQEAVRQIVPGAAMGKILIQRDEAVEGKPPRLYFVKLPASTHLRKVVLVDPMLATGQSAIMAIGELLKRGVPEENIVRPGCAFCAEGVALPPSPVFCILSRTALNCAPPQTFVNVVACPEGLEALFAAYPKVKVFTGAVDVGLNSAKFIYPGLGDFGDRYFGTSL